MLDEAGVNQLIHGVKSRHLFTLALSLENDRDVVLWKIFQIRGVTDASDGVKQKYYHTAP